MDGLSRMGYSYHEIEHGVGPVAEDGNHGKNKGRCHCGG